MITGSAAVEPEVRGPGVFLTTCELSIGSGTTPGVGLISVTCGTLAGTAPEECGDLAYHERKEATRYED